jgi:hypothetical protein
MTSRCRCSQAGRRRGPVPGGRPPDRDRRLSRCGCCSSTASIPAIGCSCRGCRTSPRSSTRAAPTSHVLTLVGRTVASGRPLFGTHFGRHGWWVDKFGQCLCGEPRPSCGAEPFMHRQRGAEKFCGAGGVAECGGQGAEVVSADGRTLGLGTAERGLLRRAAVLGRLPYRRPRASQVVRRRYRTQTRRFPIRPGQNDPGGRLSRCARSALANRRWRRLGCGLRKGQLAVVPNTGHTITPTKIVLLQAFLADSVTWT